MMKISLRKASVYAKACEGAAAKIDLTNKITLTPQSHGSLDLSFVLTKASSALTEKLNLIVELHTTKMSIRALIGKANAAKINPLLAMRETLELCEKSISTALETRVGRPNIYSGTTTVDHNATMVQKTLAALGQRTDASATGMMSIEVNAFSPEAIREWETELAAIKRKKIEISDVLASENLTTTIELNDEIVAILRKNLIIE